MLTRSAALSALTLLPDLIVFAVGYPLLQNGMESKALNAAALIVLITNYGLPLLLMRVCGPPVGALLISGMAVLRLLHALAMGSSMAHWESSMGFRKAALLAYALLGAVSFVAASLVWFSLPPFGPP
ncbi:MAG: hypothetical protein F9K24_00200 [Leptonema illini]|uniref:Uncharacterized protein n=1 Tax=Leptonema illini TaxID=183 RepID=A0A833M3M5_9LEPT|nr:MAG: hypothetical protein F9K24_00200 [Leptonema illini]